MSSDKNRYVCSTNVKNKRTYLHQKELLLLLLSRSPGKGQR